MATEFFVVFYLKLVDNGLGYPVLIPISRMLSIMFNGKFAFL